MDAQLITLIQNAVRDGLSSASVYLLFVALAAAGGGAFLGSYLNKKAEQRALKEDFDQVLSQLRAQAEATERVRADVAKELSQVTQRLGRRSSFEQHILLERYKLVCEFAHRLSRVTTDLNRTWHGSTVAGFLDGDEIVPLTAVFEDLAARSFQLSSRFHAFFEEQAGLVLLLAQATTPDERVRLQHRYTGNLQRLAALVNEAFGTEDIAW